MKLESNDLDFEEAIKKLNGKSKTTQLKIIWEWIKSDHISFKLFERLIVINDQTKHFPNDVEILKTTCKFSTKIIDKLSMKEIHQFANEAQEFIKTNSNLLFIVENSASFYHNHPSYHYHLSKSGKSGQPALCGEKNVMSTQIPVSNWNSKPGHIPSSYCQKCDKLK
jgi:hypothetical protein